MKLICKLISKLHKLFDIQVVAKDALDVYIEHRLMMEQRMNQTRGDVTRNIQNKYPPELLRRLYVFGYLVQSFVIVFCICFSCISLKWMDSMSRCMYVVKQYPK